MNVCVTLCGFQFWLGEGGGERLLGGLSAKAWHKGRPDRQASRQAGVGPREAGVAQGGWLDLYPESVPAAATDDGAEISSISVSSPE